MIASLRLRNFRGHAAIDWSLDELQVLFGPNGVGKTSLLDAFSFLKDIAINGAERASSRRDHGIGLRYDGAAEGDPVEVGISTESASYLVRAQFFQGRIDPLLGEELVRLADHQILVERASGSSLAKLDLDGTAISRELREPDKLALGLYLDLVQDRSRNSSVASVDQALRRINHYSSRAFNFWSLKNKGSEVDVRFRYLDYDASNLWAVLRFLNDRRAVDRRFDRILEYMREAFPGRFENLVLEQTAPSVIIGSFVEHGRTRPIAASGVSDGFLQLLILLTALFGQTEPHLLLFDEPETSLHPEATGVFSEAVREATRDWGRQVIIATHHPALLSQIELSKAWELKQDANGRTGLQRVIADPSAKELLEDFPLGSIYMTGAIAPQHPPS